MSRNVLTVVLRGPKLFVAFEAYQLEINLPVIDCHTGWVVLRELLALELVDGV